MKNLFVTNLLYMRYLTKIEWEFWRFLYHNKCSRTFPRASPCLTSWQVKGIVFDQTGTITLGTPTLTMISHYVDESVCSLAQFLVVVGMAENNSEHPIATGMLCSLTISMPCHLFSFFYVRRRKVAKGNISGKKDPLCCSSYAGLRELAKRKEWMSWNLPLK